ncbi:MAG: hypothetical protein Q4D62_00785 [Planctomycetia bacterium]|nr:hypothetical protein [Planctomycetia bacterium]
MSKLRKYSFLLFALLLTGIAFVAPERFWSHTPVCTEEWNQPTVPEVEIPLREDIAPGLELVDLPREADTETTSLSAAVVGAYPQSEILAKETSETKEKWVPSESLPSTAEEKWDSLMDHASPMIPSGTFRTTTHRISMKRDLPIPAEPGINGRSLSGPRTHIIMDGDTLEMLARRYLRDPDRAEEIYEHNKEILASPDELTIGAKIVLPD